MAAKLLDFSFFIFHFSFATQKFSIQTGETRRRLLPGWF